MARQRRFWMDGKPVSMLSAAADAGGRTSAYFSMQNAHKATIVCAVNQGNAATVLWTPLQATALAGTGSKACGVCPIAVDLDTDASDFLIFSQGANFTTDAAVKNKLVMFEVMPDESMDINNRYDHIAISTGASNAANITWAFLYLFPNRMSQANIPSASV